QKGAQDQRSKAHSTSGLVGKSKLVLDETHKWKKPEGPDGADRPLTENIWDAGGGEEKKKPAVSLLGDDGTKKSLKNLWSSSKKPGYLMAMTRQATQFTEEVNKQAKRMLDVDVAARNKAWRVASPRSDNPCDEFVTQPVRSSFWSQYRVPNQDADWRTLEQARAQTPAPFPKNSRHWESFPNFQGSHFALTDPRLQKMDLILQYNKAVRKKSGPGYEPAPPTHSTLGDVRLPPQQISPRKRAAMNAAAAAAGGKQGQDNTNSNLETMEAVVHCHHTKPGLKDSLDPVDRVVVAGTLDFPVNTRQGMKEQLAGKSLTEGAASKAAAQLLKAELEKKKRAEDGLLADPEDANLPEAEGENDADVENDDPIFPTKAADNPLPYRPDTSCSTATGAGDGTSDPTSSEAGSEFFPHFKKLKTSRGVHAMLKQGKARTRPNEKVKSWVLEQDCGALMAPPGESAANTYLNKQKRFSDYKVKRQIERDNEIMLAAGDEDEEVSMTAPIDHQGAPRSSVADLGGQQSSTSFTGTSTLLSSSTSQAGSPTTAGPSKVLTADTVSSLPPGSPKSSRGGRLSRSASPVPEMIVPANDPVAQFAAVSPAEKRKRMIRAHSSQEIQVNPAAPPNATGFDATAFGADQTGLSSGQPAAASTTTHTGGRTAPPAIAIPGSTRGFQEGALTASVAATPKSPGEREPKSATSKSGNKVEKDCSPSGRSASKHHKHHRHQHHHRSSREKSYLPTKSRNPPKALLHALAGDVLESVHGRRVALLPCNPETWRPPDPGEELVKKVGTEIIRRLPGGFVHPNNRNMQRFLHSRGHRSEADIDKMMTKMHKDMEDTNTMLGRQLQSNQVGGAASGMRAPWKTSGKKASFALQKRRSAVDLLMGASNTSYDDAFRRYPVTPEDVASASSKYQTDVKISGIRDYRIDRKTRISHYLSADTETQQQISLAETKHVLHSSANLLPLMTRVVEQQEAAPAEGNLEAMTKKEIVRTRPTTTAASTRTPGSAQSSSQPRPLTTGTTGPAVTTPGTSNGLFPTITRQAETPQTAASGGSAMALRPGTSAAHFGAAPPASATSKVRPSTMGARVSSQMMSGSGDGLGGHQHLQGGQLADQHPIGPSDDYDTKRGKLQSRGFESLFAKDDVLSGTTDLTQIKELGGIDVQAIGRKGGMVLHVAADPIANKTASINEVMVHLKERGSAKALLVPAERAIPQRNWANDATRNKERMHMNLQLHHDVAKVDPARSKIPVLDAVTRRKETEKMDRARGAYAQFCEISQLLPRLKCCFKDMLGNVVDCHDEGLNDEDLLGLSVLLTKSSVQLLDLSGNVLLTDKSVIYLLQKLGEDGCLAQRTLRILRMQRCRGISDFGLNVLTNTLSFLDYLQEIDLSSTLFAPDTLMRLCDMLGGKDLKQIALSDMNMPVAMAEQMLLAVLGKNQDLQNLDISWNPFNFQVWQTLRECVASHGSLRCLDVSACAVGAVDPDDNEINIFLEGLGDFHRLKYLVARQNMLNSQSALIMEAALYGTNTMVNLFLGQNPLGIHGCRAMLRYLATSTCCDYIEMSSMMDAGGYDAVKPRDIRDREAAVARMREEEPPQHPLALPIRRFVNPSTSVATHGVHYRLYTFLQSSAQRQYQLNLSLPGQRAILSLLLRIRERLPKSSFEGLSEAWQSENLTFDEKRKKWIVNAEYASVEKATIRFSFRLGLEYDKIMAAAKDKKVAQDVGVVGAADLAAAGGTNAKDKQLVKTRDEDPAVSILNSFQESARVLFTREAELKVVRLFKEVLANMPDLGVIIQALSMDFFYSYLMVAAMISFAPHLRHKILYHCFGSLSGGRRMQKVLFLMQAPSPGDLLKIAFYAKRALGFCPENPSGRYSLELSDLADYVVAQQLLILDQWEQTIRPRVG
ncbi:unnamed protein product, partial [Amoebophrya sp. A120]